MYMAAELFEDKFPKQKKSPRHKHGKAVYRMDENNLERRNQLQPQQLKDVRVLHNFKEVNGKDMVDPRCYL